MVGRLMDRYFELRSRRVLERVKAGEYEQHLFPSLEETLSREKIAMLDQSVLPTTHHEREVSTVRYGRAEDG